MLGIIISLRVLSTINLPSEGENVCIIPRDVHLFTAADHEWLFLYCKRLEKVDDISPNAKDDWLVLSAASQDRTLRSYPEDQGLSLKMSYKMFFVCPSHHVNLVCPNYESKLFVGWNG